MIGFWLGKLREELNMNMRPAVQHIGEVIEQCVSDGVESISATSTVMVDKGTPCDIQLRHSSVNTDDNYESPDTSSNSRAKGENKLPQ